MIHLNSFANLISFSVPPFPVLRLLLDYLLLSFLPLTDRSRDPPVKGVRPPTRDRVKIPPDEGSFLTPLGVLLFFWFFFFCFFFFLFFCFVRGFVFVCCVVLFFLGVFVFLCIEREAPLWC